jgi:hypothetical protein
MPSQTPSLDRTNPFCAARLRPGTIDFIFEQGLSLEQLADVLAAHAWRGQIIGGHGTGKSTLLAGLIAAIEGRGRTVKLATLSAGERDLPPSFISSLRDMAGLGVAVVDGFGQLRLWHRLRLKRFCQACGLGLLVTSHRSAGLPNLYETAVDEARAWQVVELLEGGYPRRIGIAEVRERLRRHQGNLRETLFDLYDLYEARSRSHVTGG